MAKNTRCFYFLILSYFCFWSVLPMSIRSSSSRSSSRSISSGTSNQDKSSKCSRECEKQLKELQSKILELQNSVEKLSKYKTAYTNLISDLNNAHLKTTNDFPEPDANTNLDTSCSSTVKSAVTLTTTKNKRVQHKIFPYGNGNSTSLDVLCDFETDADDNAGGWTVIQRRGFGERAEFNRGWDDYVQGFGSLDKNFWLGLDNIYALTKNGDQELRIEIEDFDGNKAYQKYLTFSISDASDFYRLSLGSSSGTAGDSWSDDNGVRFSTKDRDNDNENSGNCAANFQSGWWFKNCGAWSNLNGLYRGRGEQVQQFKGIIWDEFKGHSTSLAKTEIKIRTRR